MRTSRWMAVLLFLVAASPASARVWTDRLGQQVEAEFVSCDGQVARFQVDTGEIRRCKLNELIEADRALVAELALKAAFSQSAQVLMVATATPAAEASAEPAKPVEIRTAAKAGDPCQPCAPAAGTYECTVMVPTMVTEMRTVNVCEWREEQRTQNYTVCKMVPETRQVTYEYTEPSYEQRTRDYTYTVMKPVTSTQERRYTVMVPHQEARTGTRRECHMVPVELTRTVCEDHGSFQEVVRQAGGGCGNRCGGCGGCGNGCGSPCGGCGGCAPREIVCRVWVPKIEKRDVKYTVMRPQTREVSYEYNVTVCKPEERVKQVQVCNYVPEQQTRTVAYQVCVPVKKTGTRNVTDYKRVEEQKTRTYTVRVPHTVQKEVPVQVCRMVEKKVVRPIPNCNPCGSYSGYRGCGGCGGCGGCR